VALFPFVTKLILRQYTATSCVTQCSQSATHLYEQFSQVQLISSVTFGPLHSA